MTMEKGDERVKQYRHMDEDGEQISGMPHEAGSWIFGRLVAGILFPSTNY